VADVHNKRWHNKRVIHGGQSSRGHGRPAASGSGQVAASKAAATNPAHAKLAEPAFDLCRNQVRRLTTAARQPHVDGRELDCLTRLAAFAARLLVHIEDEVTDRGFSWTWGPALAFGQTCRPHQPIGVGLFIQQDS
jgi:hypothetical protein